MQDANAAASSWHSKLTPAWVSLKAKLALPLATTAAGLLVSVGAGGATVSIVQVYCVGSLTRLETLTASTANVWEPSASAAVVNGLVQALYAAPSMLHWKLTVLSASEKANTPCFTLVGFDGLLSIDGAAGRGACNDQV